MFKAATGMGEDEGAEPLPVQNGVVLVGPNMIPPECDQERYLLWLFRHELAHAHHCPYDIRTAYSLEKAAFTVIGQWDLAYLATFLFSDFQVDFNYLPRRFRERPYHVEVLSEYCQGITQITAAVYRQMLKGESRRKLGKIFMESAKEIEAIMSSNRPWHTKAQMLAVILERMRMREPRLFSKKAVAKYITGHPLPVHEDLHPASLKLFDDTFGSISDATEAEAFFKQWIMPRLSQRTDESFGEALKSKSKEEKRRKRGGEGSGKREESGPSTPSGEEAEQRPLDDKLGRPGQEPLLRTSIARHYSKLSSKVIDEAFWKKYWFRSRAERTIMQFLSESQTRRPTWAVAKFPDDWLIEDEIDKLDVEVSLEDGPLIPEITTMKWYEEPSTKGQSVISGFVPSVMAVLDGSMSMSNIHNEAATSAFIAYLCARKAGGETSSVAFSTNYVMSDWKDTEELKEMALSLSLKEYTVFPVFAIDELISKATGSCFIIVITDGGWQNIDEAIPLLERIVDRGHKVIIFQLPGGAYPERMAALRRSPKFTIHKVDSPERDLQSLVLSEAMKTYQAFI
jgi:hypothetical protein